MNDRIEELKSLVEQWKHAANEWADVATNGCQWLKNVQDGTSDFETALADMKRGFEHCRSVQPK